MERRPRDLAELATRRKNILGTATVLVVFLFPLTPSHPWTSSLSTTFQALPLTFATLEMSSRMQLQVPYFMFILYNLIVVLSSVLDMHQEQMLFMDGFTLQDAMSAFEVIMLLLSRHGAHGTLLLVRLANLALIVDTYRQETTDPNSILSHRCYQRNYAGSLTDPFLTKCVLLCPFISPSANGPTDGMAQRQLHVAHNPNLSLHPSPRLHRSRPCPNPISHRQRSGSTARVYYHRFESCSRGFAQVL